MQLDNIAVAVRPRNPWESIDLGFVLVRCWWRTLLPFWFGFLLLFGLPVYALSYFLPLWVCGLILWWLKPLFDRLLLFFFSRAMFGEFPGIKSIRGQFWQICKPRLLWGLTLDRFNLSRALILPVWQLEGLRGKQAAERIRLLLPPAARTYSSWLNLSCFLIEWVIYTSLIGLLALFLPLTESLEWSVFFFGNDENDAWWLVLCRAAFNITALGIVEPLYVAAGFTLYLNRRTHMEGWDIEISFRRLAARLKTIAPLLLAVCLISLINATPLYAAGNTAQNAKPLIQEILATDEFSTENESTYWRYTGDFDWLDEAGTDPSLGFSAFVQAFAQFIELLLWVLLAFAIVWLLFHLRRYAQTYYRTTPSITAFPPPIKIFASEPVQGDIAAEAAALCEEGRPVAALSLLYRASLQVMQNRHILEVQRGDTEARCLQRVKQNSPDHIAVYFSRLTQTWQSAAYAGNIPESNTTLALCREWTRHFGATV